MIDSLRAQAVHSRQHASGPRVCASRAPVARDIAQPASLRHPRQNQKEGGRKADGVEESKGSAEAHASTDAHAGSSEEFKASLPELPVLPDVTRTSVPQATHHGENITLTETPLVQRRIKLEPLPLAALHQLIISWASPETLTKGQAAVPANEEAAFNQIDIS